ncbi:hypothetical protein BDW75DRAFT_242803 [Aspergillus navahoensis]
MGCVLDKARYLNRTLSLSGFVIDVSTFNYGFDNQAFATTQAMDAFTKYFGKYDEGTEGYALNSRWLSLFNSLNYIGFAEGVIMGSLISAQFGRRWCMFTMSICALITATITVTSNNTAQIIATLPADVRGLVVGTYQLSVTLGGMVINAVCYGTSRLTSNRAWRIPLGLFYIVPAIIAASVFFLLESPRWLLQQNRVDEAKAGLQKLRKGAFPEDQIDKEFRELEFALENEVEQGKFIEIFRGKNLRRTLLVVVVNFFQQDAILKVLMLSSVIMLSGLITMAGLGVNEPVTTQRMKGVISLTVLFGVGFASGWGPLTYVVVTEVSSLRVRDHTSRLGFAISVYFNFAINFSVPYLVFEDEVGL